MIPKEVFELVKQEVQNDNELPIVVVSGDKDVLLGLAVDGAEARVTAMAMAGLALMRLHPKTVCFSSTGWMTTKLGIRPSEDPDRQEVVVLIWCDRDKPASSVSVPFSRVGGELIWGEETDFEVCDAPMMEAFWRGVERGETYPSLAEAARDKFFGGVDERQELRQE